MRAPKILAVASAVDLDFRYGCTPAWWQLWKGIYEAGVDLIVTPYRGRPVESPWWRTAPNPTYREGEAYARLRTAAARLKGDRYLRRAEDEPGDTDRLQREVIWRVVTPRWKRHLERILERERDVDAVVVFTVPMSHLRGIPAHAALPVRLAPNGVGPVKFGLRKDRTVARLRSLFGAPSSQGVNTACGLRYTEVEWGDLVAEFRSKRFTGYRYRRGGYPLTTPGSPHPSGRGRPRLATAAGITLGSTLRQLRAAYPTLRVAGASTWRAANGLVFVDNAKTDPTPPSSRIVEIKIGTCGGF